MKAVFFDFDGTLTSKGPNIWKSIWQACGYDVDKNSYYYKFFLNFINNKITHKQWCRLTFDKFAEAGLTEKMVNDLADNIKLIDGLTETLQSLKNNGYSLHIVSGNIISVIERALKENINYFDSVNANKLVFKDGIIDKIIGTNYDFEGKSRFIYEFKEKTKSSGEELVFVGNGGNDEWAYLAGCKTICVNPDDVEFENNIKWNVNKGNITNLSEILDDIVLNKEK